MGYFLERVFPLCGVRFISVNDYYDSADFDGSTGGVDVAFKFLIHEQYSKDLSRKIKAAKEERQRRGEYIYCPFGFKKVDNKMVIDEPAADTVRWIFELAGKGRGTAEIQSLLYTDNRQTPTAYKKGEVSCLWEKSIIRKILRDEQYIGTYVAGKTKTIEVGSKNVVQIPPEDWIRISNHHPAIVEREIFDKVKKFCKAVVNLSKATKSAPTSDIQIFANLRSRARFIAVRVVIQCNYQIRENPLFVAIVN